jgi:hypothetical protein
MSRSALRIDVAKKDQRELEKMLSDGIQPVRSGTLVSAGCHDFKTLFPGLGRKTEEPNGLRTQGQGTPGVGQPLPCRAHQNVDNERRQSDIKTALAMPKTSSAPESDAPYESACKRKRLIASLSLGADKREAAGVSVDA